VDDTILIADADPARAQQLARELAERGFGTSHVATGAAALEAAIGDAPDVLVAMQDLPLIAAPRLAEILRANPRTRGVRLVYVGADAAAERANFDEALVDANAVVERIELLLGKREQLGAVERASAGEVTVEGDLAQIALADVLQLLHQNRRTGCLAVAHGDGAQPRDRGELWLRDGNVVQAKVLPRALDEKALYRMLGWREGSFSFTPSDEMRPARIQTPTRALLLEGMRQLDEWNQLVRGLPPGSARVAIAVPSSQIPKVVHPVAQEVLLLLEAYDDVRSIVDHCTHSDYQVLRTLQTLIDRGIVRLRRDRERRFGGAGVALFDAPQAKRFRDWLESGRPRGAALAPAKLLLASADPAATAELLRALEQLPGVERLGAAGVAASDLAPLARLAVADGLAIELIHLPARPLYAPLWPAAAYGALGLVILHASPIAESEAQLRALGEAFRGVPESRTFHVLLLRKGERIGPDEVQEKLALLSHASLFLLPLDGERDPAPLLRTMLARVMP
jgi:CheY-like chemotaxis protein